MNKKFVFAVISVLLSVSEGSGGSNLSKVGREVVRPVKQAGKVVERTVRSTGKVTAKVVRETGKGLEKAGREIGKGVKKGGVPLALGVVTGGAGLALGASVGNAIMGGAAAVVGTATGSRTKVGVDINAANGQLLGTRVEVQNRVGQTVTNLATRPEKVNLSNGSPKHSSPGIYKRFGDDFFENICTAEGRSFEAAKSFVIEDTLKCSFTIKQIDNRYYSELQTSDSSCLVSYLSKCRYSSNIGSTWEWIKRERGITDFQSQLVGSAKRAASYYFFEATALPWQFECISLNGEEYCRCYVPGLESKYDICTPVKGNRGYLIRAGSNYQMPIGFVPESVRLKRQEEVAKKRERDLSPEPVETTLRQAEREINNTLTSIYRDCRKYILDVTPEEVKTGAALVFEYVKHGTPHCVKEALNYSLDQLNSALTKLDEGAEYSGTACRRFLRDKLGVSQGLSQDAGDIVRLGGQVAVSLVPTAATQMATKAFRVMKLSTSGAAPGHYRVIIKEKEPKYVNINLNDCETKTAVTKEQFKGAKSAQSERVILEYGKGKFWEGLITGKEDQKLIHLKRKAKCEIRSDGTYFYKFDPAHQSAKVHLHKYMHQGGDKYKLVAEVNPETGAIKPIKGKVETW